ncbi:MAG: autotransporter-associated beta strand repeat-containing protein [Opitutae bacterium]|nr:autotransporter-associated beta strand repeat-containing protein [Opitutae bacterium]
MTTQKILLPTLVAASAMAFLPTISAQASGSGTEEDPYTGLVANFSGFSADAGTTIYVNGLSGWLPNSSPTYNCNINIGTDGFSITDGYSSQIYTFTGSISGEGDWSASKTSTNGGVDYHFIFTGDLSNYSGNLSLGTWTGSYIYFGNGGTAATDTTISGRGSVSSFAAIKYNYSGYASADSTSLSVGNTSVSAKNLEFAGSVNYTIDENTSLTGYDSTAANNTLTISNAGTTTVNGSISNFGAVSVASSSTLVIGSSASLSGTTVVDGSLSVAAGGSLALSGEVSVSGALSVAAGGSLDLSGGTVTLSSAIENSGTVTVDSSTTFVLDNLGFDGDWETGATFTLFTGEGTVNGFDTDTLTIDNFSSEEISSRSSITISGNTVTFTVMNLVWAGTAESNSWTNDTSNTIWTHGDGTAADYFSTGDHVEFSSAAAYKTVSISTDINSGKAIVSADYTFEISNGATLTATKLDVESGSTLTIAGNGSQAVVNTDLEGEGTIVLTGTSTNVNLTAPTYSTIDIQLLTTSTDNATRTVKVESGVVWMGATGISAGDTTSLGTNTTLEISSGATFVSNNQTLTLANLNLSGTFYVIDGTGSGNTLTVSGATTVSGADATIAIYWNKLLSLGTLNGDSDSTLTILGSNAQEATAANATQATLGNFSGSLVITGRSGDNTTFQLKRNAAAASFESLSLTNSTLLVYGTANNNGNANSALTIGQVDVSGTGTIRTTSNSGYFVLNGLSGTGATLNLSSQSDSTVATIYDLGKNVSATATNDFTGTIEISTTNNGDYRGVSLVISDGDIAKGAVISFGTEGKANNSLSLGVNASEVTVAGLSSTSGHTGVDIIYSGSVTPSALGNAGANITSDGTARTLTINVAEGASYDFYGTILDGVSLKKTGEGSQAIHGESDTSFSSFNGSVAVEAGTLTLDGDFAMSSLSVSEGATVGIAGASTISADSTIAGGLSISGSLAVTNGATVDLTGVTSSQAGGSGTLSVSGEGSTVKVSLLAHGWDGRETNFGSDMYNATLQIADGGTLEVTAAQTSGDTSGGDRAFSVTSGTGTYKYSGEGTSYIDAVSDRNIHLADGATLDFDVVADATLDVAMKIANGMSATADLGDSVTTSTGALKKTGEGTLILSGENLYSGGTTVAVGTLVVEGATALGSGNVAVDAGATLQIDVAFTTSGEVTFASGSTLAIGEDILQQAIAGNNSDAAVAAIDDNEDSVTLVELITAESITFGDTLLSDADDINALLKDYIAADLLEAYDFDWSWDSTTGVLAFTATAVIPEPSMFGVLAGISALALVATRRRRRNNRKA